MRYQVLLRPTYRLHYFAFFKFFVLLLYACLQFGLGLATVGSSRQLDPSYRPDPLWGCEAGLSDGEFHVVVATLAPEPTALVPWIWNLGLTGAEIWIYHRLLPDDPRLAAATATFAAFEPYPCNSTVRLQPLLPNKGREAAVYLTHIVRHYHRLPEALVLVHDHGPAARHSLCGPFFRRLRGYYAGIREQREQGGGGAAAAAAAAAAGIFRSSGQNPVVQGGGGGGGDDANSTGTWSGEGTSWRKKTGWSVVTMRAPAARRVLARFADQAVSLSSGCQENWLKGCCARLVCSDDGDPSGLPALMQPAVASPGAPLPQAQVQTASTQTHGSVANTRHSTRLRQRRELLQIPGLGVGFGADGAAAAAATLPEAAMEFDVAQMAAAAAARRERATAAESAAAAMTPQGRCPFRTPKCLANASTFEVPHKADGLFRTSTRWVFLHGAGGLYDPRFENIVVLHNKSPEEAAADAMGGISNVGFGPLSLMRYAGPDAVETIRVQSSSSRSLDYPEGEAQRTKQQTYAELARLLRLYNVTAARVNFKSCCASLMLRPRHIKLWPLSLYEQMLSYTLDERNTYHAALAVSHHAWNLWAGGEVGPSDLLRYFEVDLMLLQIRGCPGWRMVVARD